MGEETRITAELRESIDRSGTAGEGVSTRASLQRRDILQHCETCDEGQLLLAIAGMKAMIPRS
jgi:hypothetical protein